jgi:hypothetical protein
MSPEERRVYMREYMRKRRASLKDIEVPPCIDTDSTEGETSEGSSWLVWGILGGIGLLMVGLMVFTIYSDIKDSKVVNKDSEEAVKES